MKTPSCWQQNEIKNLIDLYKKYHMPVEEIGIILDRTNRDIMKKLIELKEMEKPSNIGTLIMTLHKEISLTDQNDSRELLSRVLSSLERRIKQLEKE